MVDVGGGIGSTSLLLAHAFPHLRFLVQDRPQVATMGECVRTVRPLSNCRAHLHERLGETDARSFWRQVVRPSKDTISSDLSLHGHSRYERRLECLLAKMYQLCSYFV